LSIWKYISPNIGKNTSHLKGINRILNFVDENET